MSLKSLVFILGLTAMSCTNTASTQVENITDVSGNVPDQKKLQRNWMLDRIKDGTILPKDCDTSFLINDYNIALELILQKELSSEIWDIFSSSFSNISILSITQNKGYYYMPESINKMQALRHLSLSDSIKYISPHVYDLKLESFTLLNTSLKSLPEGIAKCNGLQELILTNNLISILPNDFFMVESLEKLEISFANIKSLPHGIEKMHHLKSLRLSNLPMEVPKSIFNTNTLEDLEISNYASGKRIFPAIAMNRLSIKSDTNINLSALINLKRAVFISTKIDQIPTLPEQLKILDLSNNMITSLSDRLCEVQSNISVFIKNNPISNISFCDQKEKGIINVCLDLETLPESERSKFTEENRIKITNDLSCSEY